MIGMSKNIYSKAISHINLRHLRLSLFLRHIQKVIFQTFISVCQSPVCQVLTDKNPSVVTVTMNFSCTEVSSSPLSVQWAPRIVERKHRPTIFLKGTLSKQLRMFKDAINCFLSKSFLRLKDFQLTHTFMVKEFQNNTSFSFKRHHKAKNI